MASGRRPVRPVEKPGLSFLWGGGTAWLAGWDRSERENDRSVPRIGWQVRPVGPGGSSSRSGLWCSGAVWLAGLSRFLGNDNGSMAK